MIRKDSIPSRSQTANLIQAYGPSIVIRKQFTKMLTVANSGTNGTRNPVSIARTGCIDISIVRRMTSKSKTPVKETAQISIA